MSFEYTWEHNEANFGPPLPKQVSGGMHISFEILLQFENSFVALRRPRAIPDHELPPGAEKYSKGLLYFCHNLIRYGESVEDFVVRTVHEQAGVGTRDYRILDIESNFQEKDQQWAFTPYALAILDALPSPLNDVTEVVRFTRDTIPDDFGWWTKGEVLEFLTEHSL